MPLARETRSTFFLEGRILTSAMIQIYASTLVTIMEDLANLERAAPRWTGHLPANVKARLSALLNATVSNCRYLELRSAVKQLETIFARVKAGNCKYIELSRMINQLRIRIAEDLEDRVFYSIVDAAKILRFYKAGPNDRRCLIAKLPEEVFDASIPKRFKNSIEDLEQASHCYVFGVYTGCAFHLMRVVERGLMEIAKLAGHTDPKPSWNNVLKHLEKTAYKTEYKDLPDAVKPHVQLIKDVIPKMQGIEHAWRNRVMHIENKLIPVEPIDRPIATEIMTAVEGFMRMLAEKLPA